MFQGASYFRFLCRRAAYGISARGLAVNTAEPGGEEFPDFEEFWVDRPGPGATQIVVYALLNGPSVTGAYRFTITPGDETVMRVKASIYCRKNPAVLGLAPLTSMFWHGKNTDVETDDFRPEVHDSDGLLLHAGSGEWIWRPLTNPAAMRTMAFSDTDPRGFGLLQRERRFANYEDLEVPYQLRPSVWVEPVGTWGRGSVRLVELHAPDETADNIVAFWVPAELPPAGTELALEYKLHWVLDQIHPPAGYAVATRLGRSQTFEKDLERFVVDFDGPAPADAGRRRRGSSHVVTVGAGRRPDACHRSRKEIRTTAHLARGVRPLRPDGTGLPVELPLLSAPGSNAS